MLVQSSVASAMMLITVISTGAGTRRGRKFLVAKENINSPYILQTRISILGPLIFRRVSKSLHGAS